MKMDKLKKHYGFFSLTLLICVITLSISGISFSHWADEVGVNADIKIGEMDICFNDKEDSQEIDISEDGNIIVNFKYDSPVPFIIGKKAIESLQELGYVIESGTENGNQVEELIFPAREKGEGCIEMVYNGDVNSAPPFKLNFEQYTGKGSNLND